MQQNPESSVGVLTMASTGRGAGARVLVSPTDDMGNILNSLHNASVGGQLNFVEGVQVAQLALKHRRNKNGAQRIVLFVGSPVEAEQKALVKVGKLLKKNNIAVDVVVLGDRDGNADKLRAFVDAANANDNSNLVRISASRRVAVPSRRRRDSCPSDEVVGGFFFDFEAVRTASSDRDAPRRWRFPRASCRRTFSSVLP